MSDNNVTIIGNITRDPELRFIPSGQAVASFGIAQTPRKRNASGEWVDGDPMFFDVSAWGGLGENIAESLTKGSRVIVSGRLQYRSWENDQGEKRSKIEIVADEIGPSLRWATAEVTKAPRNTNQHQRDESPF